MKFWGKPHRTSWHDLCAKSGVKNVTYTAGPKSGAFVHTNLSAMHHSAENRVGLIEVGFACFVVAMLVGFALLIVG